MLVEPNRSIISDRSDPPEFSFSLIPRLIAGGWQVVLSLTALLFVAALVIGVVGVRTYHSFYIAMPVPAADDPTRNPTSGLDLLERRSGTPDWEMYLALLTSTNLAGRLVQTTPILQRIFPQDWDPRTRRWNTAMDFWSASLGGKLHWLLGSRTKRAPDKFTLQNYLLGNLRLSPIPQTSQVLVSLDGPDPRTALMVLNALHQGANDIVREARLYRAVGERENLLHQLSGTQITDYRQILLGILSKVETGVMTASIKGQYAAILVDGPVSDPFPVFPNTKLLVEFALVAGVLGGLILIIFTPLNDAKLLAAWVAANRFVGRRIPSQRNFGKTVKRRS